MRWPKVVISALMIGLLLFVGLGVFGLIRQGLIAVTGMLVDQDQAVGEAYEPSGEDQALPGISKVDTDESWNAPSDSVKVDQTVEDLTGE